MLRTYHVSNLFTLHSILSFQKNQILQIKCFLFYIYFIEFHFIVYFSHTIKINKNSGKKILKPSGQCYRQSKQSEGTLAES